LNAGSKAVLEVSSHATSMEAKYFSIPELAHRWRCSRGTVYNMIRGEKVLDFARPGHRGKKLIPHEVVERIEQKHMRCFR
jgi:predicted DNA-binding transcriptional regulator AlpA